MPSIPIPEYQQQIAPQADMLRGAPHASGADVSSGIDALASSAERVQQQKNEFINKKNLSDDHLDISTSMAQSAVDWQNTVNDLKNNIKPGDPDLPTQLKQKFDEWAPQQGQNLKTQEGKNNLQIRLADMKMSLLDHSIGWQATENARLRGKAAENISDNLAKLANAQPDQAQIMANQATADQEKIMQSPVERAAAIEKITNSAGWGAETALTQTQDWKPDQKRWSYAAVDFQKQEQLQKMHEAWLNEQDRKVRVNDGVLINNAQSDLEDLGNVVKFGAKPDPSVIQKAQVAVDTLNAIGNRDKKANIGAINAAAKGKELIDNVNDIQKYASMTIAQRNAALDNATTAALTPSSNQPALVQKASLLNDLNNNMNKRMQQDPLVLYGSVTGQPIPELDLTNPIGEQLLARKNVAAQATAMFGQTTPLISDAEAKSIVKTLTTPEQKMSFINSIPDQFKTETLQMIGRHDPSMMVAGSGDHAFQDGSSINQAVLLGDNLRKTKAFEFQSKADNEFDQEFDKYVKGAFDLANQDSYTTALMTAKNAYAYLSTKQGKLRPDSVSSDSLFKQAMTSINPMTDFNSKKTFMPMSMSDEDFIDESKAGLTKVGVSMGLEGSVLRNFADKTTLVNLGPVNGLERYALYSDGKPRFNNNGTPQTIDIDPTHKKPVFMQNSVPPESLKNVNLITPGL